MLKVVFAEKAKEGCRALAVGVHADGTLRPSASADARAVALAAELPAIPRFQGEEGGEGEVALAHSGQGWLALVGLGEAEDLDASRLRAIGGELFAELADAGFATLTVAFDLTSDEAAELAYGMSLRAWRPAARYRSKPKPEEAWTLQEVVVLVADPAQARLRFARLEAVASSVAFTRDLVVAPANELTPEAFVERLLDLESLGIVVEVLDEAALALRGLNLLRAVGRGSAHPPRLAVLSWKGAKGRPLVFVGKGITFDTGGIVIKDDEDMDEMKGDMAGAAAAAGAIRALALRKAPVHAVAVLAIAENMVSGRASRPGDVVTSFARLSVEIIDTDAEGRLALADALAFAAGRFKPRLMVDLATLTGAVEVALGKKKAGLFANDDALAEQLLEAAEAEDEPLWRLPLTDLYDEAIRSPIADLRNCSWDDEAPDALHAARFLQHFVPEGLPWAHLDIAGTSEVEEDEALSGEGPTGFGVRLLDHLAQKVAEE